METEPQCWRRFSKGLSGLETLKPDLALTTASVITSIAGIVEIDLASHSPAAVVRKCHIYNDYWVTETEQQRSRSSPKSSSSCRAKSRREGSACDTPAHRLKADLFEVDLLARHSAHYGGWVMSRQVPRNQILIGDARQVLPLRRRPAWTASSRARRTFGCAITRTSARSASSSVDDYVHELLLVGRKLAWVLKSGGSFWLNLGRHVQSWARAGSAREEPRPRSGAHRPGAHR